MTTVKIVPAKFKSKADADRVRGLRAAECLTRLLATAKRELVEKAPNTLSVNYYALGLGEAEAAMEAWRIGGKHPFFDIHRERVASNRPAPSSTELAARRMVLLLCVALERIGFGPGEARKIAAKEVDTAGVFADTLTHRVIEHWQHDHPLVLNPGLEQFLATAIAVCGYHAPHKLALFFIGHCHLVHNPAPQVTFEP